MSGQPYPRAYKGDHSVSGDWPFSWQYDAMKEYKESKHEVRCDDRDHSDDCDKR